MTTTAYGEVLARLVAARRFGVRLGLERMRELLDRLGVPDRALGTVIHVGGTNGKGSTVAMIAALAASGGARVATYTSPHLATLRERIAVAGALATEDAIVAAAARVSAAGGDELTFFEQITAIAMVIVADARADVTVLEVGLGGRLDATNVVDAPVAVVTGVALDHEAILGPTLDAIAIEKAGIWKPGRAAIVGASGEPAAVPVLVERARAVGVASLRVIDDADVARVPAVGLPGAHQRRNAAAALAAVEIAGLAHDPAVLATVRHPGRFERVRLAPELELVLDGAHNPHGARALAATLREQGVRPVLVLAISADKDARAIVRELVPDVSAIVATRYQQERAMDPEALAAICRDAIAEHDRDALARRAAADPGTIVHPRRVPVETAPDLVAAVARARALGTPVLIAGSLFVVGEARVAFLGAPADPVAVSDPSARST